MSEQTETSEDALIDTALAALEQAPPAPATPWPGSGREQEQEQEQEPVWTRTPVPPVSPTLDALDATRRPNADTVCEECPNSVWFASPAETKCYCRVMFLVTWSSTAPTPITHCDGVFLGQDG